jgi:GrpB-like predicted nucleotidyltransferase (UPF0157 family)
VASVRVGNPAPRAITVVPYDAGWPAAYAAVEAQVRAALGAAVLALDHVGSTSVPGLAAKPVIDVDLTVASSADEPAYLPALEAAGFVLRIREPAWEEHRLLTDPDLTVNLHVFPQGAPELARHRMFRDWLRAHPDDREVYGAHKAELATRGFTDGMDYNNHKGALVYDLYEKIFAADPEHAHDPQPRD